MKKYYEKLKELCAETRKANTDYFADTHNYNDARMDARFRGIWEKYDAGISSIRSEIAARVRAETLPKTALASFDEVVRELTTLSGHVECDWTDEPFSSALTGAESIISAFEV